MNRSLLNLLLGCFVVCTVMGCGDTKPTETANPIEVPPGWKPEDMHLTCANAALCPDNQGILFSISKNETSDGYTRTLHLSMYRCTATVYQTDKILTAGHCVEHMKDAQEIYFKTAEKPGAPSRTFRVKQPLGSVNSSDTNSADYGAFQLADPATGIALAHPSALAPADAHEVIAFVVNPISEQSRTYTLDAVTCRHNATSHIPLDYIQNPSTFDMYDCKIYSGNSGGVVVLAKDPLTVLGVVHASNNANDSHSPSDDSLPRDLDRLLGQLGLLSNQPVKPPQEKIDVAVATNARCFELPGWPKSENNCVEISAATLKPLMQGFELQKSKEGLEVFVRDWLTSPSAKLSVGGGAGSIQMSPKLVMLNYSDRHSYVSSTEKGGIVAFPIPECISQPWPGSKDFTVDVSPDVNDLHLNFRTGDVRYQPGSIQIPFHLTARYISGDEFEIEYSFKAKNDYLYSVEFPKLGDYEQPQSETKRVTIPACQNVK